MEELALKLKTALDKADIMNDTFVDSTFIGTEITGDWKHDHLCADQIARGLGLRCVGESDTTDMMGNTPAEDDFYVCTHYYRPCTK